MLTRGILAVGAIGLAIAVAVALGQRGERLAGSDRLLATGFPVALAPGQEACQAALLPNDTARVKLVTRTAGGRAGGPLAVTLRAAGRTLAAGRLGAGWTPGEVVVPVSRLRRTESGMVCVRNSGTERIALGGAPLPRSASARVNGRPTHGGVRVELLRPGRETWLDVAPAVAHRMGLGRAGFLGSWLLWAVAAVMLGAGVLAARVVLREARP